MTRKWNLPLTYEPKINPVIDHECTQTIRLKQKFNKGDLVRFYVWEGTPYRSKRRTITEYMPLIEVINITITRRGIYYTPEDRSRTLCFYWSELDNLAKFDGIIPATGEALRDVLFDKNKLPKFAGELAQIIRWKP